MIVDTSAQPGALDVLPPLGDVRVRRFSANFHGIAAEFWKGQSLCSLMPCIRLRRQ